MSRTTLQGRLGPAHGEYGVLAQQSLEVLLAARLELEGRIARGVLAQCGRDEDLPRPRVVRDAGCQHHVAAVEVLGVRDHEAGVEADSDRAERPLELDRG